MLKKILCYFSTSKYTVYYIALLSLLMSLVFVLFVYPRISDSYNAVLDTDRYGSLGFGLWKNGSLSFYPDVQPTVNRGPVYPFFMAVLLKLSNGWWPLSVQLAQCLCFSITCLLVFWISKTMWNRTAALFSSLCCALHPFLVWYTSRIWIETLATFLFTALVAVVVYYSLKPNIWRAFFIGALLAVCTLCKQTFMPFIILIPFLLGVATGSVGRWRNSACIFATAVILVSPWTVRNWQMTGKVIPVHLLAGFNFQVGDSFVDDFNRSSFSYAELWVNGYQKIKDIAKNQNIEHLKLADQEVLLDNVYLQKSLSRYLEQPGFFFRKLLHNAVMYWTLGETRLKSSIISLMQVPLLLLFIFSSVLILRRYGILSIQAIPVFMVCCYFGVHLPIFAFARLSVVLVPVMLVIGWSIIGHCKPFEKLDGQPCRLNRV